MAKVLNFPTKEELEYKNAMNTLLPLFDNDEQQVKTIIGVANMSGLSWKEVVASMGIEV